MNILSELKDRFRASLAPLVDDPKELLAMIRPAQVAKFGDYQANCAMPLGKRLGKPPREIAARIIGTLDVVDISQNEMLVRRHGADLPVLALRRETGVIAGTLNWPFDSGLILRWLSELE